MLRPTSISSSAPWEKRRWAQVLTKLYVGIRGDTGNYNASNMPEDEENVGTSIPMRATLAWGSEKMRIVGLIGDPGSSVTWMMATVTEYTNTFSAFRKLVPVHGDNELINHNKWVIFIYKALIKARSECSSHRAWFPITSFCCQHTRLVGLDGTGMQKCVGGDRV